MLINSISKSEIINKEVQYSGQQKYLASTIFRRMLSAHLTMNNSFLLLATIEPVFLM